MVQQEEHPEFCPQVGRVLLSADCVAAMSGQPDFCSTSTRQCCSGLGCNTLLVLRWLEIFLLIMEASVGVSNSHNHSIEKHVIAEWLKTSDVLS